MNIPIYYTLKQCDTVTVENATMPYMKSLYSILNRVIGDGYTDDFKPTTNGLQSRMTTKVYRSQDFLIINTFRFEGNSNPADNVIMYIIETTDGQKGTLVSGYGTNEEEITRSLFKQETHNVHNFLK